MAADTSPPRGSARKYAQALFGISSYPGGASDSVVHLPTLIGKLQAAVAEEDACCSKVGRGDAGRRGHGRAASLCNPREQARDVLTAARSAAAFPCPSLKAAAAAGKLGALPLKVSLKACRKRSILPKFIRAVHEGCLGRELDLTGLSLGDLQLEALLCDAALVPAEKVNRWRLRDTRISAQGVGALMGVLNWETELLNLARNDIGLKGMRCLAGRMGEGRLPRLRSLDLSSTGINCTTLVLLSKALLQCPFLLRLDLNHNGIQDGEPLGEMVAEHTHLSRLSLNNNYLSGRAVGAFFEGVLQNARNGGQISDIGIAWNGFGKSNALAGAEAIAAVLAESVTLYHLDLSYNSLDSDGCAAIGKGLRDNHHLYGLHLVGNSATMDADGFLQPLQDAGLPGQVQAVALPGQLLSGDPRMFSANCLASGKTAHKPTPQRSLTRRNNDSVTSLATACSSGSEVPLSENDILRERDDLEQVSTCWACEGWTRVELQWQVPSGEPEPQAVWAFTSLDGFRSALRLHRLDSGADRFAAARMVPGGCKLGVIFQVDGAIRTAPGMSKEALGSPVEVRLRSCLEFPSSGSAKQTVEVSEMGLVNCAVCSQQDRDHMHGQRTVLLDGPDGCPVQMLRVTETEFKLQFKRQRSAAFFTGFAKETPRVMDECLNEDWSKAKIGRIVGEADWPAVQKVLKDNYRSIVAVYRLTSTLGVSGETSFGVNQIELSDLVAQAGLIDSRTRIADVDRLFIAAKVINLEMKRGLAVRNDKALSRHQFLEFLLRLADQRFVQTGETATVAEALQRVLDAMSALGDTKVAELDHFLEELHTEVMDDVYKSHRQSLQAIYKEYSGRNTKPGLANFMSFAEFQELLELVDAFTSDFPRQRAGFAFRMGMMTQSEETYASRFQEMSFVEFQHALGAVVCLRAKFAIARFAELIEDFFSKRLSLALSAGRGVGKSRGCS